MTPEQRQGLLAQEQAAYDRLLPDMLAKHSGKFVVFHSEEPQGYFDTYDAAYGFALDTFGLDAVVLVAMIKERDISPASISWHAGVLFG
jgi:hypothetical protein